MHLLSSHIKTWLTYIEVPLEFPNGKRMGGTIGSEISSSPSDKYVADDPRSTPVGTNGRIITLGSEAVEEGERDITLLLSFGRNVLTSCCDSNFRGRTHPYRS